MRHTATFRATDGDRRNYLIMEFVHEIPLGTLDGPGKMDGLKEYRLSDGSAVNRISDTEYEIVSSGVRVTVLPS